MVKKHSYKEAKTILLDKIQTVSTVIVNIDELQGRILAEDIIAWENIPAYARSVTDGYALMASDTSGANKDEPVRLKVIESIIAGQVPFNFVSPGTAIRLVSGSPIPGGADAVCAFKDASRAGLDITVQKKYETGENIIFEGEYIDAGEVIARKGTVIDAGMIGDMALLGVTEAEVYRRTVAGIISTGDEVVDIHEPLRPGMIRNSNRYTIEAALKCIGIDTVYLGHAADDTDKIKELICEGEEGCDIIISTGGVSDGEYDLTASAMEKAGYELFVKGVDIRPGMPCLYGIKSGKLMLALSGNPASALANLQCVCYPALKKLIGIAEYDHKMIQMKLKNDWLKVGKGLRFICGSLKIENGIAMFEASEKQENEVFLSASGCNSYGIIPGGRGPLKAGTVINGFIIDHV